MKKKHRGLKIFLGILLGFAVIIGGFVTFVLLGKDAALALKVENVPLASVADGVYTGSYNGFRFSNTVKVTVSDHKITDITVTKPQVFMKDEAVAALTGRVKTEQCMDVDVVSGATADSNALLTAVENALKSAASE